MLPWPIFAATSTGKVVEANPAAQEILDAEDIGRDLETQVRAFAGVGDSPRKPGRSGQAHAQTRDILVGRTAFRLHRLPAELARLLCSECVLVGVERRTVNPLKDTALRERFGLTPRQARIARQLARGKRADEIARELKLSVHTVRRHTEAVLLKTGVTSRSALLYRILGQDLGWDEFPED